MINIRKKVVFKISVEWEITIDEIDWVHVHDILDRCDKNYLLSRDVKRNEHNYI